MRVVVLSM